MKGRTRSKQKTGWVTYAAVRADPNGTRAERRAWERQFGKKAAAPAPARTAITAERLQEAEGDEVIAARKITSAPEQTSAKPDTPA